MSISYSEHVDLCFSLFVLPGPSVYNALYPLCLAIDEGIHLPVAIITYFLFQHLIIALFGC